MSELDNILDIETYEVSEYTPVEKIVEAEKTFKNIQLKSIHGDILLPQVSKNYKSLDAFAEIQEQLLNGIEARLRRLEDRLSVLEERTRTMTGAIWSS